MLKSKYIKNGDYLIPHIALLEQVTKPLGKYGGLRRTYLKRHRQISKWSGCGR